jgi:hypothetical protein
VKDLKLAIFLVMAVLLSGFDVQAKVLLSMGSGLAFEYANNARNLEIRQPLSLRAGYRFSAADLLLERALFSYSQGTSALHVRRTHEEWLAWGRRLFQNEGAFKLYAALGAGAQFDKVETSLNGETTLNTGRPQPLAAIAGGFNGQTLDGFELDLELRAAFSSGYAPNPVPGLGIFAGWRF